MSEPSHRAYQKHKTATSVYTNFQFYVPLSIVLALYSVESIIGTSNGDKIIQYEVPIGVINISSVSHKLVEASLVSPSFLTANRLRILNLTYFHFIPMHRNCPSSPSVLLALKALSHVRPRHASLLFWAAPESHIIASRQA